MQFKLSCTVKRNLLMYTTFTPQIKGKPVHIYHILYWLKKLTRYLVKAVHIYLVSTILMRYPHCYHCIYLRYGTPNRSAHYLQISLMLYFCYIASKLWLWKWILTKNPLLLYKEPSRLWLWDWILTKNLWLWDWILINWVYTSGTY